MNETEPFWTRPNKAQQTVAYQPGKPTRTWKHDAERILNHLDDFYSAAFDLMPAIAAVFTLIVLVIVTPHR